MADLVRFHLEAGGTVLVEVEGHDPGSVRRGGRIEERIEEAGETLEHVLGRVAPVASGLFTQLHEQGNVPSEVEVEFGVKLTAEASAIIARTSGEASFRVLVRWVSRDGLVVDGVTSS